MTVDMDEHDKVKLEFAVKESKRQRQRQRPDSGLISSIRAPFGNRFGGVFLANRRVSMKLYAIDGFCRALMPKA